MKQIGIIIAWFIIISGTAFGQESIFKMHLVYDDPLMKSIEVRQINYKDTLKADLYLPIKRNDDEVFPAVIFVSGFAKINFRTTQIYSDWARLLAAHGLIGIVYETRSPSENFDDLLEYTTTNANQFNLDKAKIGIWSCSGNSLLAISKVNSHEEFKCHVIYYGMTVTPSSRYLEEAEDFSKAYGFAYEINNEYVSHVPTFMVRTGNDKWDLILKANTEFINEMILKNMPFELINYDQGDHSFDMYNNNESSRHIILKTVTFLTRKLNSFQVE